MSIICSNACAGVVDKPGWLDLGPVVDLDFLIRILFGATVPVLRFFLTVPALPGPDMLQSRVFILLVGIVATSGCLAEFRSGVSKVISLPVIIERSKFPKISN